MKPSHGCFLYRRARLLKVNPNETPQWLSQNQNPHNAAIMLRTLRSLWKKVYGDALGFDKKVRVIPFSVSPHISEIFAHWTAVDEYADVLYKHSLITSLSLGIGQAEWQRVRSELQNCVEWVMKENKQWIINALKLWRRNTTRHS